MTDDEYARATERLSQALQPQLHGQPPGVQGGALADLTAIWLAGHVVLDDADATAELRRDLLELHFRGIWSLVEFHHERLFGK